MLQNSYLFTGTQKRFTLKIVVFILEISSQTLIDILIFNYVRPMKSRDRKWSWRRVHRNVHNFLKYLQSCKYTIFCIIGYDSRTVISLADLFILRVRRETIPGIQGKPGLVAPCGWQSHFNYLNIILKTMSIWRLLVLH